MSAFDATTIVRRDTLVAYCRDASAVFNPRFPTWLLEHFSIYEQFEAAGDKVRAAGHLKYSAFVVVNVLRWRADTTGQKFRMTNTFVPDLARLYNITHSVDLFKVSTRFATKESNDG